MNRSLFAAAAMVLGSFLITTTGCGGPEATCKKMKELAEKEMKDSKDKKEKSADDQKKDMDDCVKKVEEEKKKDPKKWDCISKCVDKANSFDEYGKCAKDCEGEKK